MDDFEFYSILESELLTSTESILISGYETTMNPWYNQGIDEGSEQTTERPDGSYIFYGLGGILLFFVIYMLCYSYFTHWREKAAEHEIELRRLSERGSLVRYRNPPINEGQIFIEDFERNPVLPVNPNTLLPDSCNAERANSDTTQLTRRIGDIHIPFQSPQQIQVRNYFSEDFQNVCPNTIPDQTTESSQVEHGVRISGWLSTPPLCYSSVPEDLEDLICPDSQIKDESLDNRKFREEAPTTPSETAVSHSPSAEGRSRSSPTSPEAVRRRLPTTEGTPRRPSSWQ